MRRILVFQHVGHEILGTLHPLLKKAGCRIRYANFGRHPDLQIKTEGYDGLVILGGPMGVYEVEQYPHLVHEMDCIREFIRDDKPVLGICLGAQLIAAALGARVAKASESEIGWYDLALTEEGQNDPVLSAMGTSQKIFQWHGDAFEVPPEGVWLATSAACPFQAFRVGSKVYGFQFHLEVDEGMIERWLRIPINDVYFADEDGAARRARIRDDTKRNIVTSVVLSQQIFMAYINLCNARSKLRHLIKGHPTKPN